MRRTHGERFGDYRLVRLLGEGSFAEVYEAEHVYLPGVKAAIKLLKGSFTPPQIDDLRQEALTICKLNHPHIVQLRTFSIERGLPYLVMKYAPNGTLLQRHPRGTPLSPTTVVSYVKQVASALQYAHNQRLIHRDVKPENMLLGANDEILLSDFGIAVVAHATRSQRVEDVIGTPLYMSPEQWEGKPVPATDQYALGILTYEWLSGSSPFRGNQQQLMYQHLQVPLPSLREKIPSHLSDIEPVIRRATAKDPRQRFESVQAFANALEQACQSEPALLSGATSTSSPMVANSLLVPSQSAPSATDASNMFPYKQLITDLVERMVRRKSSRRVIGGKYKIIYRIPNISTDETYIVKCDDMPSNFYVVKEFRKKKEISKEILERDNERFNKEGEFLQNLRHPSIPTFISFFQEGECYYFVIDFIAGCNLEQILEAVSGPLDEAQVIRWMMQICDALAYLHSLSPSVVLNDIRPDDILVTAAGDAKLTQVNSRDRFRPSESPRDERGIHRLDRIVYKAPGLERINSYMPPEVLSMFSVGYMAPEVLNGFSVRRRREYKPDTRSDIYSLAATIYELLTKEEPPLSLFSHGSIFAKNPHLRTVEADKVVDCPSEQVIIKAMQDDPEQRFQSAAAMRAALQACLPE